MKYLKLFESYVETDTLQDVAELLFVDFSDSYKIISTNRIYDKYSSTGLTIKKRGILEIIIHKVNLGIPFTANTFEEKINQLQEYLGSDYYLLLSYGTYRTEKFYKRKLPLGNIYNLVITICKK